MLANKSAFRGSSAGLACTRAVLIGIGFVVSYVVCGGNILSCMLLSAIAQCFGVIFLCLQVSSTKDAAGISAKAVALDAFAIVCRLACTAWSGAYIPDDPDVNFLCHSTEILSVLLILRLLYMVKVAYRDTYQATKDSGNVMLVALVCLLLGAMLRSDLADCPVFDALWMSGLFAGTIASLPQLGLICRGGGRTHALTSHYIIACALSRSLSGTIMWLARDEITSDPWIANINHSKWAILMAYALQMLLVTDFAYYYLRSAVLYGFRGTFYIPASACESWTKLSQRFSVVSFGIKTIADVLPLLF